jgi:hypothetical protein
MVTEKLFQSDLLAPSLLKIKKNWHEKIQVIVTLRLQKEFQIKRTSTKWNIYFGANQKLKMAWDNECRNFGYNFKVKKIFSLNPYPHLPGDCLTDNLTNIVLTYVATTFQDSWCKVRFWSKNKKIDHIILEKNK